MGKNHYVEVKSWYDDRLRKKIVLFRKEYPYMKLVVIGRKTYTKLQKCYAQLIPQWEVA